MGLARVREETRRREAEEEERRRQESERAMAEYRAGERSAGQRAPLPQQSAPPLQPQQPGPYSSPPLDTSAPGLDSSQTYAPTQTFREDDDEDPRYRSVIPQVNSVIAPRPMMPSLSDRLRPPQQADPWKPPQLAGSVSDRLRPEYNRPDRPMVPTEPQFAGLQPQQPDRWRAPVLAPQRPGFDPFTDEQGYVTPQNQFQLTPQERAQREDIYAGGSPQQPNLIQQGVGAVTDWWQEQTKPQYQRLPDEQFQPLAAKDSPTVSDRLRGAYDRPNRPMVPTAARPNGIPQPEQPSYLAEWWKGSAGYQERLARAMGENAFTTGPAFNSMLDPNAPSIGQWYADQPAGEYTLRTFEDRLAKANDLGMMEAYNQAQTAPEWVQSIGSRLGISPEVTNMIWSATPIPGMAAAWGAVDEPFKAAGAVGMLGVDATFDALGRLAASTPRDELGAYISGKPMPSGSGQQLPIMAELLAAGGVFGQAIKTNTHGDPIRLLFNMTLGSLAGQGLANAIGRETNRLFESDQYQANYDAFLNAKRYIDSLTPEKKEGVDISWAMAPSGGDAVSGAARDLLTWDDQIAQLTTGAQVAKQQGDALLSAQLGARANEMKKMGPIQIIEQHMNPLAEIVYGSLVDPVSLIGGFVAQASRGTTLLRYQDEAAALFGIGADTAKANIDNALRAAQPVLDKVMTGQPVNAQNWFNNVNPVTWFNRTPDSKANLDTNWLLSAVADVTKNVTMKEDAKTILSGLRNDATQLINGLPLVSPTTGQFRNAQNLTTFDPGIVGNEQIAKRLPILRLLQPDFVANLRSLQGEGTFNPVEFLAEVDGVMYNAARQFNGAGFVSGLPAGAVEARPRRLPDGTAVLEYLGKDKKVVRSSEAMTFQEARTQANEIKKAAAKTGGNIVAKGVNALTNFQRGIMSDNYLALSPRNWIRNTLGAATLAYSVDGYSWRTVDNILDDLARDSGGAAPTYRTFAAQTGYNRGQELGAAQPSSGFIGPMAERLTGNPNNEVSKFMRGAYDIPYGKKEIPLGGGMSFGVGEEANHLKVFDAGYTRTKTAAWGMEADALRADLMQLGVPEEYAQRIAWQLEEQASRRSRNDLMDVLNDTIFSEEGRAATLKATGIDPSILPFEQWSRLHDDVLGQLDQLTDEEATQAIYSIFDEARQYPARVLSQFSPQQGRYAWTDFDNAVEGGLIQQSLKDTAARAGVDPAQAEPQIAAIVKQVQEGDGQWDVFRRDLADLSQRAISNGTESVHSLYGVAMDFVAGASDAKEAARVAVDKAARHAVALQTPEAWARKWQTNLEEWGKYGQTLKQLGEEYRTVLAQAASGQEHTPRFDIYKTILRWMEYDPEKLKQARTYTLGAPVAEDSWMWQELIDANRSSVDNSLLQVTEAFRRFPSAPNFDLMTESMREMERMGAKAAGFIDDAKARGAKGQRLYTLRNETWTQYFDEAVNYNKTMSKIMVALGAADEAGASTTWVDNFAGGEFRLLYPNEDGTWAAMRTDDRTIHSFAAPGVEGSRPNVPQEVMDTYESVVGFGNDGLDILMDEITQVADEAAPVGQRLDPAIQQMRQEDNAQLDAEMLSYTGESVGADPNATKAQLLAQHGDRLRTTGLTDQQISKMSKTEVIKQVDALPVSTYTKGGPFRERYIGAWRQTDDVPERLPAGADVEFMPNVAPVDPRLTKAQLLETNGDVLSTAGYTDAQLTRMSKAEVTEAVEIAVGEENIYPRPAYPNAGITEEQLWGPNDTKFVEPKTEPRLPGYGNRAAVSREPKPDTPPRRYPNAGITEEQLWDNPPQTNPPGGRGNLGSDIRDRGDLPPAAPTPIEPRPKPPTTPPTVGATPTDSEIRKAANDAGIPTAQKNGRGTDHHLVASINKRIGTSVNRLDELTPQQRVAAVEALAKRAAEQAKPAERKNPFVDPNISYYKVATDENGQYMGAVEVGGADMPRGSGAYEDYQKPGPITDKPITIDPNDPFFKDIKGQLESVRNRSTLPAGPLLNVSADDISYDRARTAYNNISMDPEKRARQVQEEYVQHMQSLEAELSKYATTPEARASLQQSLEEYRQAYVNHQMTILDARSRTASSMVTGPSNFPTARNQKRLDAETRRINEFMEWQKRAEKKLNDQFNPSAPRAISSDRVDAVDALAVKLAKAEELQERMVAGNKIVRGKGDDASKIQRLIDEVGLTEANARKALEPDYMGRKGFPDFALKNNNAEIRRLRERMGEVQTQQARPTNRTAFEGGYVLDNQDNNRIQIIFDQKPDEATRAKLKSNGFKWAPSENAWQRQRTEAARSGTERVLGIELGKVAPDASKAEGTVASNLPQGYVLKKGEKFAGTGKWAVFNEEDVPASGFRNTPEEALQAYAELRKRSDETSTARIAYEDAIDQLKEGTITDDVLRVISGGNDRITRTRAIDALRSMGLKETEAKQVLKKAGLYGETSGGAMLYDPEEVIRFGLDKLKQATPPTSTVEASNAPALGREIQPSGVSSPQLSAQDKVLLEHGGNAVSKERLINRFGDNLRAQGITDSQMARMSKDELRTAILNGMPTTSTTSNVGMGNAPAFGQGRAAAPSTTSMFAESGEDLPLVSGAATRPQDKGAFVPQDATKTESMFDMRPQMGSKEPSYAPKEPKVTTVGDVAKVDMQAAEETRTAMRRAWDKEVKASLGLPKLDVLIARYSRGGAINLNLDRGEVKTFEDLYGATVMGQRLENIDDVRAFLQQYADLGKQIDRGKATVSKSKTFVKMSGAEIINATRDELKAVGLSDQEIAELATQPRRTILDTIEAIRGETPDQPGMVGYDFTVPAFSEMDDGKDLFRTLRDRIVGSRRNGGMKSPEVGEAADSMLVQFGRAEERLIDKLPQMRQGLPNALTPQQRLQVWDRVRQSIDKHDNITAQARYTGEKLGNFVMLNQETDTRHVDAGLRLLFPFSFFASRMPSRLASMPFNKPSLVNFFYEVQDELNKYHERQQSPVRLGGSIPLGGDYYMGNPLAWVIPLNTYITPNPYVRPEEGDGSVEKAVDTVLQGIPGLMPATQYAIAAGLDYVEPKTDGTKRTADFELGDYVPAWRWGGYGYQALTGNVGPQGALAYGDRFDTYRATRTAGAIAAEQGIDGTVTQYAQQVITNRYSGKPDDENVDPSYLAAATKLADQSIKEAGGERALATGGSWATGTPFYQYREGERDMRKATDEHFDLGYDANTNPTGSKEAQGQFMEQNPELSGWWSKDDAQPGTTARTGWLYDQKAKVNEQMRQAEASAIAAMDLGNASHQEMTDAKDAARAPLQPQLDAINAELDKLQAQQPGKIPDLQGQSQQGIAAALAPGNTNPRPGMSPAETSAAFLRNAMFQVSKLPGKPAKPGDKASPAEWRTYGEAMDAYTQTQERFLNQSLASANTSTSDALRDRRGPVTYSPTQVGEEWWKFRNADNSNLENMRRTQLDRQQDAYNAANAAQSMNAKRRVKGGDRLLQTYLDTEKGDARAALKEKDWRYSAAVMAAYDTDVYDQTVQKFGRDATINYFQAYGKKPQYPGEGATEEQLQAYYDASDAYDAKYPSRSEIDLWLNGRYSWSDMNSSPVLGNYDRGADYDQAVAIFGKDIFTIERSANAASLADNWAGWRNANPDKYQRLIGYQEWTKAARNEPTSVAELPQAQWGFNPAAANASYATQPSQRPSQTPSQPGSVADVLRQPYNAPMPPLDNSGRGAEGLRMAGVQRPQQEAMGGSPKTAADWANQNEKYAAYGGPGGGSGGFAQNWDEYHSLEDTAAKRDYLLKHPEFADEYLRYIKEQDPEAQPWWLEDGGVGGDWSLNWDEYSGLGDNYDAKRQYMLDNPEFAAYYKQRYGSAWWENSTSGARTYSSYGGGGGGSPWLGGGGGGGGGGYPPRVDPRYMDRDLEVNYSGQQRPWVPYSQPQPDWLRAGQELKPDFIKRWTPPRWG